MRHWAGLSSVAVGASVNPQWAAQARDANAEMAYAAGGRGPCRTCRVHAGLVPVRCRGMPGHLGQHGGSENNPQGRGTARPVGSPMPLGPGSWDRNAGETMPVPQDGRRCAALCRLLARAARLARRGVGRRLAAQAGSHSDAVRRRASGTGSEARQGGMGVLATCPWGHLAGPWGQSAGRCPLAWTPHLPRARCERRRPRRAARSRWASRTWVA